jgi:hypothetical protein
VSPNRERHYRALFRFCRILGEEAVLQAAAPEVRLCPSRNFSSTYPGFHRLYFINGCLEKKPTAAQVAWAAAQETVEAPP